MRQPLTLPQNNLVVRLEVFPQHSLLQTAFEGAEWS